MEPKKPWQSKTLLLNGVFGVLAGVALFLPQAAALADQIKSHGVEIGLVWSVLNIVLRAITKERISLTD